MDTYTLAEIAFYVVLGIVAVVTVYLYRRNRPRDF